MEKNVLLQKLPPFLHRYTPIKQNQSVYDIVKEVLAAHEIFAGDYDRIASEFNRENKVDIAKALFNFLKSNVAYDVESEESQTTKSPSALLVQGYGDCKHYAGFIAGVLDAINRLYGKNIDWNYRFASYNLFDSEPGHVFVVMHDNGKEYWIDPVLKNFNERLEPTYILDKKPKQMLQRVSGIYDNIVLDDSDKQLSPELIQAIALLLDYNVLNAEGEINDTYLVSLQNVLSPEDFKPLADARALLHTQAIGGLFSNIWSGIKTATLSLPRTAYLQLVLINFKNYAANMAKIIFVGNTLQQKNDEYMNELKKKWESLGGKWDNLVTYVAAGRLKKEVLNGTNTVGTAAAAWAATAAVIIAAMTPIVNNLVNKIGSGSGTTFPTGTYPTGTYPTTTSGGIMDFVQNNPLVIAGAAAMGIYYFSKKKRSA